MPSYNAASPAALYPGTQIALVNDASVDASVTKTQQFAVAPGQNGAGITLMAVNTTNHDAQGQFALTDADADYEPLSGFIVAAGSAFPYNLTAGWMRFTFVSAPTSGSLIVSR